MTKFIKIGWDYVPYYGNGYYSGQISVPDCFTLIT